MKKIISYILVAVFALTAIGAVSASPLGTNGLNKVVVKEQSKRWKKHRKHMRKVWHKRWKKHHKM